MRPVNPRAALFENYASLIGTIDVASTKHSLPPCTNSSFWYDEIVVAVALYELRSLSYGTSIDRDAFVK
jgi:hypothetical protein